MNIEKIQLTLWICGMIPWAAIYHGAFGSDTKVKIQRLLCIFQAVCFVVGGGIWIWLL